MRELSPQADAATRTYAARFSIEDPNDVAALGMTAIVTMADEGDGTRYIATVMHPDQATKDRHEQMGFFQGWNTCIDQLEAFAGEFITILSRQLEEQV